MKQPRTSPHALKDSNVNTESHKVSSVFLTGLIPVIFAILLYANTIPNDFALDDYAVVLKNKFVKEGLSGIPDLLTGTNFAGYDGQNNGVYRPVPMITYALEFPFIGLDPHFRHFINLLLYATTGFFLFILLRKLIPARSDLLPLSITLLFLAQPVHTDAVANIKGRDEILAFLFSILALISYIRYARSGKSIHLAAGVFCYILAFFSKESSLPFILIIPLALYLILKIKGKPLLYICLSLLCGFAVMIAWRSYVIYVLSEPMSREAFSLINNALLSTDNMLSRIGTGLWLQSLYLWKLIIPFPLSYDYSYAQIPVVSIFSINAIVSVLLITLLLIITLVNYRKNSFITFWILFYFLTILIVANIFIYIGSTFAERFLYTPSLGFAAITGVLLYRLISKKDGPMRLSLILKKNKTYTILLTGILILYSGLTISRNKDWKNNLTLFTADQPHAARSARVNYNLGNEFHKMSKLESDSTRKALLLRRSANALNGAVKIYPEYLDAIYVLGLVYTQMNFVDSAIFFLNKAVAVDSNFFWGYSGLGQNYLKISQFEKAKFNLKKFLKYMPGNNDATLLLANTCFRNKDFNEAIGYFKKCRDSDPGNIRIHMLLCRSYGMTGQYPEALDCLKRAQAVKPDDTEILINIGVTYSILSMPDSAIVYFKLCIRLQPDYEQPYSYVISSYEKKGDYQSAAVYRNALSGIRKSSFRN